LVIQVYETVRWLLVQPDRDSRDTVEPYAPSAFARTKGCHKTASGKEAVRPPKTTQQ